MKVLAALIERSLTIIGVVVLLALIVPLIFPVFGIRGAGRYELLPTRNSNTDESQVSDFYLGPLVFRIENRFLQFPFSKDSHPARGLRCGAPNASETERKACDQSQKRSVFLQIEVPSVVEDSSRQPFVSGVTLGYRQGYVFDDNGVDEFLAEQFPGQGSRERVPALDTENYAAVHVLRSEGFRENSSGGKTERRLDTYFFVAKENRSPHIVSCSGDPNDAGFLQHSRCNARAAFLVDEFPRDAEGKYPFTLEYNFPGADIDRVSAIEAAVIASVSALPRSLSQ